MFRAVEPVGGAGERQRMTVGPGAAKIRPYVVCAVLRGVTFDTKSYKSFMDLQVQAAPSILGLLRCLLGVLLLLFLECSAYVYLYMGLGAVGIVRSTCTSVCVCVLKLGRRDLYFVVRVVITPSRRGPQGRPAGGLPAGADRIIRLVQCGRPGLYFLFLIVFSRGHTNNKYS